MTAFALPPPARSVGTGDPPADMNAVINAVTALGAGQNVLNSAFAGGADLTGSADSAAAFNAAIPAGAGFVYVPAGTYKIGSTVGPLTTNQWIVCAPGVFFSFTGTGDCFRFVDSSTYTTRTRQGGGIIGRPIIDGTSSGTGSTGVHAGDILQLRIDVAVQNFTGAGDIGVHLDNQNYWTEQLQASVWANNCTNLVVLDSGGAITSTGSYDRADLTVYLSQFAGQEGVVLQNGAQIVGGRLRIFGNVASSTSALSNAVLTFTGATAGGHSPATFSGLAQCQLDINVESDGGHTFTAMTISYGSTSNVVVNCSGNVSFGPGNQFTQSNLTTVSAQFAFLGPIIGDPVLAEVNIPTRMSVSSSVTFFSQVSLQRQALLENLSPAPGTPTGGGYLYADATGHLTYKGPSGTVTTLAPP